MTSLTLEGVGATLVVIGMFLLWGIAAACIAAGLIVLAFGLLFDRRGR